jgi:hypothetical protein
VSVAFEEAFNLICGEKIGYGMSRIVYECSLLPNCVVKVEEDPYRFQNVLEWETWNVVKNSKEASKWFAICRWISPTGRVLIQERTRTPGPKEFVERVPVWFTDMKRANWGINSSGRLVCHDYGTSFIVEEGTQTKRMKKAEWYDE